MAITTYLIERRRRPRGPKWKKRAAWFCLEAFGAILSFVAGWPLYAAGFLLALANDWTHLHRAPCDPEAPPLTEREWIRIVVFDVGAIVLALTGMLSAMLS